MVAQFLMNIDPPLDLSQMVIGDVEETFGAVHHAFFLRHIGKQMNQFDF
jgi:hypothetical protein